MSWEVVGASPTQATNLLRDRLEMVPARSHKPFYAGSSPAPATMPLVRRFVVKTHVNLRSVHRIIPYLEKLRRT